MRKNIYIKDEDQELFKKAEALGGGNFSAMIAKAARHFVEVEESKEQRRLNKMKNKNNELLTLLENDNNFRFEVKHAILSQISTIEKRINSIKEMRQDQFTADTVRHYQDISLKNLNKFLVLLDEI